MAKHAQAEAPLEKADRLIAELQDDGTAYGAHRSDMAYINILLDFPREHLQIWPATFYRGPSEYWPNLQQSLAEVRARYLHSQKTGQPFIFETIV